MADTWFSAKEWKARLVEFAGRRSLRNVANGETATYDVSRSEGQVSQEGDAFNTKNMNDLEQRISNGFANAKTNIDALNRDLGGLSFGQDAEGNWGYKIGGADPVIPFRRVAYTSQMVTLGDSESAKFTFGTVSGFKLLSYTLKTDFSDRQVYLYVNNVKINECASGIKTGTYDLDIAQNYKIELRSRWGICSGSISLK